jgi:hypothetical protein
VVAPSIPGFGFSPAPNKPGYGPIEAAHTFHVLMQQLNYTQYVIQGGDLGSWILRFQAWLYPKSVVSVMTNLWSVALNETDLERYANNQTTPDETVYVRNLTAYVDEGSGYRYIQEMNPLQLAYAMTDSPLGNLLWNWQIAKSVTGKFHLVS